MTDTFDEFQRELIVESTFAGSAATAKRSRCGDRPKAVTEQAPKHAEAMLNDIENYPFVGYVIDQHQIELTAFLRYSPSDRIKQLRNEHANTV